MKTSPTSEISALASMTGFGRAETSCRGLPLSVEIKGVNARYAEIKIRLPAAFPDHEAALRQKIQQEITRGRVDVVIRLGESGDLATEPLLDLATAKTYLGLAATLAQSLQLPSSDLPLSLLFQLPGVIRQRPIDLPEEELQNALDKALLEALGSFLSMRREEGEHLRIDLLQRLDTIQNDLDTIQERAGEIVPAAFQRLQERLQNLLRPDASDPARLHQEIALLAERTDVSEEITRLRSHLKQFASFLRKGGAIGRKLDFLCQELHREANTIGSKAQDFTISQHLIAIKAEIEKIREQVQNIE